MENSSLPWKTAVFQNNAPDILDSKTLCDNIDRNTTRWDLLACREIWRSL
jgi:hypothetical protein